MKSSYNNRIERGALNSDKTRAFLGRVISFHGQPEYYAIQEGISLRNYRARVIFWVIKLFGRFHLANIVALYAILLFYSVFQKPGRKDVVACIDPRWTNKAVIDRVLRAVNLNREGLESGFGKSIGTRERLRLPWRHTTVESCAQIIADQAFGNPMVHAQALISMAALMLFNSLEFSRHLRMICVATDHSPVTMALLEVAEWRGLKTCYIQHAPVADHFPPLDYDLSVLFDQESIEIYDRAAQRRGVISSGRMIVLPPFEEERLPISLRDAPLRVGICLSYLFNTQAVRDLVQRLDHHPAVSEVLLRRHPRSRDEIGELLEAGKAKEPARSSVADFLSWSDIVLVPNSGVAIESLHLGKPTFYTPGLDYISDDYYGFVRRGIVPLFDMDMMDDPAGLTGFFGSGWRRRYAAYDQTGEVPLATSRKEVREAFLTLLRPERCG